MQVILTDLDPGQTYYYQVGDPILLAMSQEFSFTMMPDSLPIRIGATADVSTSINTKINIGNLTNAHLDLMLIIGDLVSCTPRIQSAHDECPAAP